MDIVNIIDIIQKIIDRKKQLMATTHEKKCIVFDFDCTLTYTHYYYYINDLEKYKTDWFTKLDKEYTKNINDIILKDMQNNFNWNKYKDNLTNILFGGEERLDNIINFLTLLKENGYDIYISSRGICNDIYKVLEFYDIKKYVQEVNANDNTNVCPQMHKAMYIMHLKKKYGVIYYVDDDESDNYSILKNNIHADITYKYFGKNIGLIKNGNGLTETMIKQISSDIKLIS